MGIKDFNKILKKYSPDAIQKLPVSNLKGYRVAVDGPLWVHSNLSICQKDMIMKMGDPLLQIDREILMFKLEQAMLRFMITWCYKGVTLVWVWDGESLPEKTTYTRKKRDNAKENIKDKIQELRIKIENMHILTRSPVDISNFKNLLCQDVNISRIEMDQLASFVNKIGFPSLIAKNDSEKLCAALAKEGYVAGVWSTDTDTYTFGAPMLIIGWGGVNSEGEATLEVVYKALILHYLKLNEQEFVDMCIMCGCDFNLNIPRVGPVEVYKLITKNRCIEQAKISNPTLPWEDLNHERCREIFKYIPSDVDSKNLNINFNENVVVGHNLSDLLTSLKFLPLPKNVTFY